MNIKIVGWVIVNGRDVRGPWVNAHRHPQFEGVFHRRNQAVAEATRDGDRVVKVDWEVPA
jgi:hypothetical protein